MTDGCHHHKVNTGTHTHSHASTRHKNAPWFE